MDKKKAAPSLLKEDTAKEKNTYNDYTKLLNKFASPEYLKNISREAASFFEYEKIKDGLLTIIYYYKIYITDAEHCNKAIESIREEIQYRQECNNTLDRTEHRIGEITETLKKSHPRINTALTIQDLKDTKAYNNIEITLLTDILTELKKIAKTSEAEPPAPIPAFKNLKTPKNNIFSTSKLTKTAHGLIVGRGNKALYKGLCAVDMGGGIHDGLMLEIDENAPQIGRIRTSKPLTLYDSIIANAVYSIWEFTENKTFTIGMINSLITGKKGASTHEEQTEDILQSLASLTANIVTITYDTKEIKKWELNRNAEREQYIVLAEHIGAIINGNKTTAYVIKVDPILLRDARLRGNLRTYAVDGYAMHELKATKQNILIRHYLIGRINEMEYTPSRPQTVLCDTLYKAIEITPEKYPSKQAYANATKRAREAAFYLLNQWAAAGEIKSVQLVKKGNKYNAFKLKVDSKKDREFNPLNFAQPLE